MRTNCTLVLQTTKGTTVKGEQKPQLIVIQTGISVWSVFLLSML